MSMFMPGYTLVNYIKEAALVRTNSASMTQAWGKKAEWVDQ